MYKVASGPMEHFGRMLPVGPESTPGAGRFRSYRLHPLNMSESNASHSGPTFRILVGYGTSIYPLRLQLRCQI